MNSKISTVLLCTVLLLGSIGIATPRAFGDFVAPIPAACPNAGSSTQTHSMSVLTSSSSASPTATLSASSSFFDVIFVLDGVTTTTVSGPGPYTTTFNGLSPGPHTIIACYVFNVSALFSTVHTDIVTFNIAGPTTLAVGGTIIPIDMTSLFIAGAMTNAFWVLPTLGGIAGTAMVIFKVKRKHD